MQWRRVWLLLSCTLSVFVTVGSAQTPLAVVRGMLPGSVVTTTGTVTTGDEWGVIRYMQDADAGIALYDADLSGTQRGDSIVVTGVLSMYQGEIQISPVISFSIRSQGNNIIPVEVNAICDTMADHLFAREINISCARVNSCVTRIADETYLFYDPEGCEWKGRFAYAVPPFGEVMEKEAVALTGIVATSNIGRHLLVSSMTPVEGECATFSPAMVSYESDQLLLEWDTPQGYQQLFQWGEDNLDQSEILGPSGFFLRYFPAHLQPHRVYQARLMAHSTEGDTLYSPKVWVTAPSEGDDVDVIFNRSVNTTFSDGSSPLATGSAAIETDLIARIDAALHTLDVAMYNTNRTTIVAALNRAHQRGVIVRYIADDETSNSALSNAQFPVFYRSGNGIMHHKFVVADAAYDGIAWVWTGSTNFSTNQLSSDPNHACILRQGAMAKTFTNEFNEMWGADGNHTDSFTGEFKRNNSAHHFLHNGIEMEVWFSPSDETECRLVEAIESAHHQLLIGLLLLTSEELIQAVIRQFQNGIEVRVILEDEESSSYAVSQLAAAHVPLAFHAPGNIYHHKYAIIDEGYPDSDPQVVSGSHNWTWSADHINDENTIVYHDQRLTNIFRQEFEARWSELVSDVHHLSDDTSFSISPNPGANYIMFNSTEPMTGEITLQDISGKTVLQEKIFTMAHHEVFIPSRIPNGMYFVTIHSDQVHKTVKWIKSE